MSSLLKRKHVLASKSGGSPFGGLVSPANLVSYWKLNEVSGTRLDSVGGNHLTPTNAPVGASGKIGNGCDFEETSSQFLSCPNNASLQSGDIDFTWTMWVKPETVGGINRIMVGKDAVSGREYSVDINPSGLFWIVLNGTATIPASTPTVIAGTWYFVVAWRTIDLVQHIQVNNGAEYLASTVIPNVTTTDLRIGAREYPGAENYFDGIIDEVGFWKRTLTPAERTALYNGGVGLTY